MSRSRHLIVALAVVALSWTSNAGGQVRINPADLIGTWQLVAAKNGATGQIDSVINHTVAWYLYTGTHYAVLEIPRNRAVLTQAQLDALAPEARMKANYAMLWDSANSAIVNARAGTYRIEGNRLVFGPRAIALEPHLVGGAGTPAAILTLNRTTFVRQSQPDANGVVSELTLRRID